ncbi:MAG: tRNA (5-methylaminomethyl-2-thiouridine)(34)-methyltransferase MnmD [Balneolaceae bacterium]
MTDQDPTRIHLTEDGSHTLYSGHFGQYYHNPNGAIAESRHNFFDVPRLKERLERAGRFSILEMGFGTGLNLLLLTELLEKLEHPPAVTFRSVEGYPISPERASSLNYPKLLGMENRPELLVSIFDKLKPGLNRFSVSGYLELELFIGPFEENPPPAELYDAIFFDPFSPEVNADMWAPSVFETLRDASSPDVLLSTYCAASGARAALAVAGWKVARTQGALGKREMTLAARRPEILEGWKRLNEERLARRYRNGEFDTN